MRCGAKLITRIFAAVCLACTDAISLSPLTKAPLQPSQHLQRLSLYASSHDKDSGHTKFKNPFENLVRQPSSLSQNSNEQAREIEAVLNRRGRLSFGNVPDVKLRGGVDVKFSTVFPVTSKERNYLVFLVKNSGTLWAETASIPLECEFEDGSRSAIQKYGAEKNVMYSWVMAWQCDIPQDTKPTTCHKVQMLQASSTLFAEPISVCDEYSDDMKRRESGQMHNLTACVPIPYEDRAAPGKSGFLQMPQWMEYNAMHGVDHFLIYLHAGGKAAKQEHRARTLAVIAPFLHESQVSVVEVDGLSTDASWEEFHPLVANDCLYRMKHRTRFLMPSIDTDEYIHFPWNNNFVDAVAPYLERRLATHSLSFSRFQFKLPRASTDLHMSSKLREPQYAKLCPKFIIRPDLVRAVFIHWVTSWEGDAEGSMLTGLWAAHYRLAAEEDEKRLVSDDRIARETQEVQDRLRARYNGADGWRLAAAKPTPARIARSLVRERRARRGGASHDLERRVAADAAEWLRQASKLAEGTADAFALQPPRAEE
eukprot:TRINITY_DN46944_c0_g1_i1.p1 TRINITY_DN46944_c0_g1~~TRINITY_DN46944_c0_g1_i1.p1  ORF type:complete len:538 (-),score=72.61 TRINITY_DN46944_c0_g1_i1:152-1765(-)